MKELVELKQNAQDLGEDIEPFVGIGVFFLRKRLGHRCPHRKT